MEPCRAEVPALSHTLGLLLRLPKFLECRQNPDAGHLQLPAGGNGQPTITAHYQLQIVPGIRSELANKLLTVSLADAQASRQFAERASRLLANEPLPCETLDYVGLLPTAPGPRRAPTSVRFLQIPARGFNRGHVSHCFAELSSFDLSHLKHLRSRVSIPGKLFSLISLYFRDERQLEKLLRLFPIPCAAQALYPPLKVSP